MTSSGDVLSSLRPSVCNRRPRSFVWQQEASYEYRTIRSEPTKTFPKTVSRGQCPSARTQNILRVALYPLGDLRRPWLS